MMNKYHNIFTSIVLDGANDKISINEIATIHKTMSDNYDHFEIIVVDSEKNPASIGNALKEIDNCRVVTIFDKKGISMHAIGVENSIGDVCVFGCVKDMTESNINSIVSKCCSGNDVVLGVANGINMVMKKISSIKCILQKQFDYNVPANYAGFGCVSRRAINALISTSMFTKMFEYRLSNVVNSCASISIDSTNEAKSALGLMDLMVLNSTKPLSTLTKVGFVMLNVLFGMMLFGVNSLVVGYVFFLTLFFMFGYVAKFISAYISVNNDNKPYVVLSDRHSSVMLKSDELNVVSESENDTKNMVQTGRDR